MTEYEVIDVREPAEYAGGHFDGAINIPVSQLSQGSELLSGIAKDTLLILYCRSGARSGVAIDVLRRLGFSNLQNGINQQTVEKTLNTA